MPRTRNAANACLHRARILLRAWDATRGEPSSGMNSGSEKPLRDHSSDDTRLTAAFLPGVLLHLRQAYGWYLLAISGLEESADVQPPESVAQLSAPPVGKAVAPELREFQALEAEGWLADMLSADVDSTANQGATRSILGSDRAPASVAVAARWIDQLESTMLRMDDSLQES